MLSIKQRHQLGLVATLVEIQRNIFTGKDPKVPKDPKDSENSSKQLDKGS